MGFSRRSCAVQALHGAKPLKSFPPASPFREVSQPFAGIGQKTVEQETVQAQMQSARLCNSCAVPDLGHAELAQISERTDVRTNRRTAGNTRIAALVTAWDCKRSVLSNVSGSQRPDFHSASDGFGGILAV